MRLLPVEMLDVTPRYQLLGQVREYTVMCKDIYESGHVNHMLINKINDYSVYNLYLYGEELKKEMNKRGYKLSSKTIDKWNKYLQIKKEEKVDKIYKDWFTKRYVKQVLYNWQEKYDCGRIPEEEWEKVLNKYQQYFKEGE